MSIVLQLSKQLREPPQIVADDRFTIRSFQPADLEKWLELRQKAFARERVGVRSWTPADFEREFRQRWWWDPAKMWLAEPPNSAEIAPFPLEADAEPSKTSPKPLLGSVTLAMRGQPASAKPVVHWLMVTPAVRRRGIARALMSRLETAAWNSGYQEVYLETHAAWQNAARFYERLGYQPVKL